MMIRVQSALAPPAQRIGATKGTFTTLTTIFAIFIARPVSPWRTARDDQIFAGQSAGRIGREEEGQRCDLADLDVALLRMSLGYAPQILLHARTLAALADAPLRSQAGESGHHRSWRDGVAGDALSCTLQGNAARKTG